MSERETRQLLQHMEGIKKSPKDMSEAGIAQTWDGWQQAAA